MNFRFLVFSSFLLWITSLTLVKGKELQTIDRTYENSIKSVLLYPSGATLGLKDGLQPPIISISDNRQLLLSFDEMGDETQNYYVQILNCNSDWTLSNLNSIMFLTDYNEFQIMDRLSSYNTRMPYIHYKFQVPKTKLSGNYLIIVYREGNVDDLILSKRFMVYESEVTITPQLKFAMNGNERNTSQQADFKLFYSAAIQNPMERMNVVVRQNYNWSNAIYNLSPVFMRDDIRTYEYTYFNNENAFKGINEFRFFDLRSLRSNGMNVANIIQTTNRNEVLLGYDKTRKGSSYGSSFDINGMYVPEQYETKGFETEPDYAEVIFSLDINPNDVPGRIFLMGSLTDWALNTAYELKWNAEYNVFSCTVVLKQGYYNYNYVLVPNGKKEVDYTFFEGSFSQTQNVYDFIAYYRGPGGMHDRIVGYISQDYLTR